MGQVPAKATAKFHVASMGQGSLLFHRKEEMCASSFLKRDNDILIVLPLRNNGNDCLSSSLFFMRLKKRRKI